MSLFVLEGKHKPSLMMLNDCGNMAFGNLRETAAGQTNCAEPQHPVYVDQGEESSERGEKRKILEGRAMCKLQKASDIIL